MYSKRKKYYVLVLLAFCIIFQAQTADAKEESRRTVRVAFPEQAGMSIVERSGKITGYNYDYLEKIAEYTGWKMEYIAYPDEDGTQAVSNAINDLIEGKVDLLGPLLRNEQTQKLFDFPDNSYGTVYTTLCALTSSNLRENNIKSKGIIKIGLWKTATTRNEEVLNYLKTENMSYQIKYYESSDEQLKALQEGEVDVISGLSLSPIANTRIVEKFAARPYYFATTKGNTKLIKELNDTIRKIEQTQPKLQDNLFERYFRNSDDEFVITKEQKECLDKIKKIKVLCVDYDAPYVYQEDGKPKGALISILNDFAKEINSTIDYTFCKNQKEAEKLLKKEEYNLVVGMPFTSGACAKQGFIKSEPILESGLSFVQNSNNSKRDTIAIVNGLEELIGTDSYKNVVLYDNARECLEALNSGKVDIAAGDRSIMEYYIYDMNGNLSTSLITGTTQKICVAVSRKNDVNFLEVLNNYIYSLSDLNKTIYLSQNNMHKTSYSLNYFVRAYQLQTTFFVIAITVLIATGVFMILYARKMNQKNQELKVANEVKSQFLARMSHDIRTPMNGIVGMLEIADRVVENPDAVRKYHEKIRGASQYLLSLINDVLDMNKLESKEIELKKDSVFLHDVIESCTMILENKALENEISIVTEGIEEFYPPRVRTNEKALCQIFINLIGNAIKYNKPNGRIYVNAKTIKKTPHHITCEFAIKDTGIGMSKEFQKKMFEPFVQESEDARSEYKGTGLGLSIVKRLIDEMGGEIYVNSKLNEGTEISWTLRFSLDRNYIEEPKKVVEVDLTGKTILVAEDNSLNAEIFQFMLEDEGAEVILVENGALELEEFKKSDVGTFDYILTDIMMPEMDGYEACKEIRKLNRPDAKTIPIIALSANSSATDASKALEMGMNSYITKPCSIEKLKECIANLSQN